MAKNIQIQPDGLAFYDDQNQRTVLNGGDVSGDVYLTLPTSNGQLVTTDGVGLTHLYIDTGADEVGTTLSDGEQVPALSTTLQSGVYRWNGRLTLTDAAGENAAIGVVCARVSNSGSEWYTRSYIDANGSVVNVNTSAAMSNGNGYSSQGPPNTQLVGITGVNRVYVEVGGMFKISEAKPFQIWVASIDETSQVVVERGSYITIVKMG